MAGAIKGITVEIGGDTTKLGKALADVNKSAKGLQSELKGVSTLLKFDPKNVTLLKQKQDILNSSIANTREKLDTLKEAQSQVQEQFDKGEITVEQYRDFQREIVATEQKLESLKAEAKEFGSVAGQYIQEVGKDITNVGKKVEDLGQKFSGVSTAAAGVLTASTVLASGYEDSVAKVGTVADTSKVSLEQLSDDMLALSTQSGKSANEIADATYQAISASVDTASAVEFVGTASNLARAGFLETADAVDVLTTIINAYGLEADEASGIADKLIQTQNDGKTTVNELSSSMGQVIPLASAYGVNIDNLCTSYAQLTKNGVATAEAGTYIKSMLSELGDAGSDVSGILQEKTGKTFGQLMADGMSLGDVLGILKDHVDGDSEAFAGLWSSTEAGTGALSLTSAGVDAFNQELGKMDQSAGNASKALETLETSSAKGQRAVNALKNAGIEFGTVILAAVAPVLQTLATGLQNLAKWFGNLSPVMQKVIVGITAIVAAIAPVLIGIGKVISIVGQCTQAFGVIVGFIQGTVIPAITALVSFLGWPVTAILAIIAILGVMYAKCEWFRDGVNRVIDFLKNAFQVAVNTVINFFSVTLPSAFNTFLTFIRTTFTNIKNAITNAFNSALTAVSTTVNNIKNAMANAFNTAKTNTINTFNSIATGMKNAITAGKNGITSACRDILTGMVNIFSGIKDTFKSIGSNVIEGIKSGITGAVSGLYSTIKSALSGLVDKAKNALGIHSPSKVMEEEVGQYIPSGVSQGIERNESTLTKSVGGMVKKTISTAKNALDGVRSIGEEPTTGVPGSLIRSGNSTVTNVTNKVEIYPQNMDRENVGEICDEINRRLGLAY